MKNLIKIVIVAAFAIVGVIALMPTQRTEAAASGELAASRALYQANCARCHGADGKANTPKGRSTEADDISGGMSTSKTIRIVTNGKGNMPAFGRKLTAAQIRSIANYVKTL